MLPEVKKCIPRLFCLAILFMSLTINLQAQDQELLDKIEESAIIFEEISEIAENGIPPAMMKKAGGIVLIPDMYKGGFIVGGRRGKGIALIQNEDGSWSRPVFVTLTGGSFGLQIGVQKIELILVFRDAESLREIGKTDFTLGGDISVAAGPVGRQSSAATNFTFDSAVYSYSKTKGVFAGLSLDGTLMEVDSKANRKFYEADEISAQDIFEMESYSDEGLSRLYQALDNTKRVE